MMEIQSISADEYRELFPKPIHAYNSVSFCELNAWKCEDIHYLAFLDKGVRLGIVLGQKDGVLCNPFSSPFGGFDIRGKENIDCYENAIPLLKEYVGKTYVRRRNLYLVPNVGGFLCTSDYKSANGCKSRKNFNNFHTL